MPRPRRSGCLRVSRSVKQLAADTLSLAEYGLLNRIWDDLRWTPCQVRVKNFIFELQAGQAVISMAGYAEQFRCRQGLVAAALRKLEEEGWFAVERSRKGTVVTCLRDPRGDPDPAGGEVLHRGKNPPPQAAEGGGSPPWEEPGSSTGGEPHNKDVFCSTPDGSTPDNNGTGAAVSTPACKKTPRARDAVEAPSRNPQPATRNPDDPDDDPPPKGGRPAPKAPVDQSAPPAPNLAHPQPAAHAPVSAVLDEILRPHPELVQAAWAAGVPLGLVAQAVLEDRDEALVLAWLLCARAKRRRLRSTAAFFRAGMAGTVRAVPASPRPRVPASPLAEPSLAHHVQAKRLLVGAGVEDLGCARCLRDLDGKSVADRWREAAKARAAAAAAAKRAEDLRRLRRLLPTLRGDRRRWAEQLLANETRRTA